MIHITPAHSFTYESTTVNVYHANKGEGLPRHEHTFDHVTFFSAGTGVIRKEGKLVTVTKETQPINLVANEWHEIEAIEDNTVFINVFAT